MGQESFMVDGGNKYSLESLGLPAGKASDTGLKEGEGVFESAVYACVACFNGLANTKTCGAIMGSSCHAYDVMMGFGTKKVEQINSASDSQTSDKTIEDSEMALWTYAVDSDGAGSPEGSANCAPIVFKARNPSASQQVVDAACSRGDAFCESKKSSFEDCCTGLVPENDLCADGAYCCGQDNAITIGKTVAEAEAMCASTHASSATTTSTPQPMPARSTEPTWKQVDGRWVME